MFTSVHDWDKAKAARRKLALVTAYDHPFASLAAAAGLDGVLVGDSLGMTFAGQKDTLGVTLGQMAYHTEVVARGAGPCLVITDLPFGSYQEGPRQAYRAAVRIMRAGAQVVKLEGGVEMAETVAFLSRRGIPICGHIGLTPQHVRQLGGFRRQGTDADGAARLRADADALAGAGARLLVLEAIPATLAAEITARISIPTIGIGAGPQCDGQVLVLHDLLGLYPGESPSFARRYLDGAELVREALGRFAQEVREGRFPPAGKP